MTAEAHDTTALGPLLATGRTADVYAWTEGRVLKLMRPEFGAAQAALEAAAARAATEAGVGAPAFDGLVSIGARSGLVYERIDGLPMVDTLTAGPWQAMRLAGQFGRVHATMHGAAAPRQPELHDVLRAAIAAADTEPAIRDAALRRLAGLPAGTALLHGDMHPGNVILSSAGPRVIDWIQATRGAPAADVARTLFLLRDSGLAPAMPPGQRALISVVRRAFATAYLHAYRRTRPLDRSDVRAWRLPVLVARLAEGIGHERNSLHRLIAGELA